MTTRPSDAASLPLAVTLALHRMCQPTEPCRLPIGVEDAVAAALAAPVALADALDAFAGEYTGRDPLEDAYQRGLRDGAAIRDTAALDVERLVRAYHAIEMTRFGCQHISADDRRGWSCDIEARRIAAEYARLSETKP